MAEVSRIRYAPIEGLFLEGRHFGEDGANTSAEQVENDFMYTYY